MTLPQDVFSLFGTRYGKPCVPIFSLLDFEPVSYTHLDVYKRQPCWSAVGLETRNI